MNYTSFDNILQIKTFKLGIEDIQNIGSSYFGENNKKIDRYNEEINLLKQQLSDLNDKMGKSGVIHKSLEPVNAPKITFWYYELKEMKEFQDLVMYEIKKKKKHFKTLSNSCMKYLSNKEKIKLKKQEEEEKKLKIHSKNISSYMDVFWKKIEKIVWEEKKRELQKTLNKNKEMRFKKFVKGAIKKIKNSKHNAHELFENNMNYLPCSNNNSENNANSNSNNENEENSIIDEDPECASNNTDNDTKNNINAPPNLSINSAPTNNNKLSSSKANYSNEDKELGEEDLTDQEDEDILLDEEMESIDESEEKEVNLLDDEANIPIEELLKKIYGFKSGEEYINFMQNEEEDHGTDTDMDNQFSTQNDSINPTQNSKKRKLPNEGGSDRELKSPKIEEMKNANIEEVKGIPIKVDEILECNMDEKHLTKIPPFIKATLRDYQHAGLHWLLYLYKNNINGILADEMGLGKTLQCISLLGYLAYYLNIWGPHLIIVPTSILINWEIELKRFCPCFKILSYYGNQNERYKKRIGWFNNDSFHICISSYSTIVKDHIIFKRKNWKYIILDEAHNIKNFNTKRWNIILSLKRDNCLLITGTPLQNSLEELWSLLHFLMPNIFTSHLDFKEWFSDPLNLAIQKSKIYDSKELIDRLHTVIRPYILRRLKKNVEKEMPNKYEHIIKCKLTRRQKILYDEFINNKKVQNTLTSGNYMGLMNILIQLRKVCNHCDLFTNKYIQTPYYYILPIQYNIPKFCLLFENNYYQDFYLILFLHNEFVSLGGIAKDVHSKQKQNHNYTDSNIQMHPKNNDLTIFDSEQFQNNMINMETLNVALSDNFHILSNNFSKNSEYKNLNEINQTKDFPNKCLIEEIDSKCPFTLINKFDKNLNSISTYSRDTNYPQNKISFYNDENEKMEEQNNLKSSTWFKEINKIKDNKHFDYLNYYKNILINLNKNKELKKDNQIINNKNYDEKQYIRFNAMQMWNTYPIYDESIHDLCTYVNNEIYKENIPKDFLTYSNEFINELNNNYDILSIYIDPQNKYKTYDEYLYAMEYDTASYNTPLQNDSLRGNKQITSNYRGSSNRGRPPRGSHVGRSSRGSHVGRSSRGSHVGRSSRGSHPGCSFRGEIGNQNLHTNINETTEQSNNNNINSNNNNSNSNNNNSNSNSNSNNNNSNNNNSNSNNNNNNNNNNNSNSNNNNNNNNSNNNNINSNNNNSNSNSNNNNSNSNNNNNNNNSNNNNINSNNNNINSNNNNSNSNSNNNNSNSNNNNNNNNSNSNSNNNNNSNSNNNNNNNNNNNSNSNINNNSNNNNNNIQNEDNDIIVRSIEAGNFLKKKHLYRYNMKVLNREMQYKNFFTDETNQSYLNSLEHNLWIKKKKEEEMNKMKIEKEKKKQLISNYHFIKNSRIPIFGSNLLHLLKTEFLKDKNIAYNHTNNIIINNTSMKEVHSEDMPSRNYYNYMDKNIKKENSDDTIENLINYNINKCKSNKCASIVLERLFPTMEYFLKLYEKLIQSFIVINSPFVICSPPIILINNNSKCDNNQEICKVQNYSNISKKELIKKIKKATRVYHNAFLKQSIIFPLNKDISLGSGKLFALEKLLSKCKKEGNKCLLFTQFIKMLDILEIFLNHLNYSFIRLDGSTKVEQRQKIVTKFNNDKSYFIFISSTRSGSIGINLTAANVVIFYDTDWNPSIDKQAMDRCHRIGQTKDVHVFRFVCEYTVEENIWKKQLQKRKLDNICINMGNFNSQNNRNNNTSLQDHNEMNKDWFTNVDTIKEIFINKQNNDDDDDIYQDRLLHEHLENPEKTNVRFEKTLEHIEDKDDINALHVTKRERQHELSQDMHEFTNKNDFQEAYTLTSYCFNFLNDNLTDSLKQQIDEMKMRIEIEMMNAKEDENNSFDSLSNPSDELENYEQVRNEAS
ncbi:Snf2-related CBP activator, putative [Plasmodium berghei]|uniref:Snf2-related CBP activator, putative n=1 Tax=Plasmodium berghei TaxID=5821 RepID=A0A113RBN5_PLABE|nr:Snf2-related CBP activator, putative [Plasmodium berghei]